MPLTTSGLSVDSANPIYKKRYEDISFAFSFAASDSVSWTGLTIKGQLRNSADQLIWDSGNISATVGGTGAATATIMIPSACHEKRRRQNNRAARADGCLVFKPSI